MVEDMHINRVSVNDVWVSFDIENVKSTSQNGQKEESIQIVAHFLKGGEEIHKIYNLGNADKIAKLLNREYAKSEAVRMIEEAKKSAHNPF